MADSVVDTKETTPVEKETVTSSVKESPVKETNGSSEEKTENGKAKNGATPKENGSSENVDKEEEEDDEEEEEEEDDEVKENGESDACPIKRKVDADAPEVTTPEKKQKVADSAAEDADSVEA